MSNREPTPEDLAAIEAEWPVIEAEMAVVAAECRLATCGGTLSIRAHRRAVAALATAVRKHTPTTRPTSGSSADAA